MNGLLEFLNTSYSAYQTVENAEKFLLAHGFVALDETQKWTLQKGGKYYVVRGGSSVIAFTLGRGNNFKIVASHTDSPCLKLKEHPVTATEPFYKLNAETYGGGIYYSLFDRPLKLAGRVVREKDGALVSENFVSDFNLVIPSLAVHMQRDVNEKFAPNPQIDLLPLLGMEKPQFELLLGDPISYDLFVTPAEQPFESGVSGEFLSAPRIDNLTSVYGSLRALVETNASGVCVAACLDCEEIGSRTRAGAGGDFLKRVLGRVAESRSVTGEEYCRALSSSFLISLDNAHSMHPNHPEKCDITNRAVMGGGIVIKSHANGAYTTDALSSAIIKKIFKGADVRYQTFYNRSDMRSGGTLGTISLGQATILSADLGLAQLAMHSAVETMAKSDYVELEKGLKAFYESEIVLEGNRAVIK